MPDSLPEDQESPSDVGRQKHRYDSFVVRVWTHGGERLARVQVRHVQTDTVETATMVDWEWVGQAMAQLMSAGPVPEDAG